MIMEDKVRKEVRKILNEEMGVQLDIKDMSDYITNDVIDFIQSRKNKISDGKPYEFSTTIRITPAHKKVTNIDSVVVIINYQKIESNKSSGSFDRNKLKPIEDGSYFAYIKLKIESPSVYDINTKEINLIISHELNHAFVGVKKFNLKPKTPIYNEVKSSMLATYKHIEQFKTFLVMFYLNLPEEIQARVQEVGTILSKLESDNYSDAVKELFIYQPVNDAKRMVKYNSSELYKLPIETLNSFVDRFNKDVLMFKDKPGYEEVEFKVITEPKEFFNYWTKFINYGGVKLGQKIVNLVAKKFNIDKDRVFTDLGESFITETFIVDSDYLLD